MGRRRRRNSLAGLDERATLVMRTDPQARYERFLQVLAVVKRAGVTWLGFEGDEHRF